MSWISASTRAATKHLPPFARWWPMVSRDTLRADLLAGLVGAVVGLPQAVAFATLAGLPPEYGLYCAMVPSVVAALFGSSWHNISGPTNAVSLFVFATLAPLAEPGSAHYISLALTLSFISGAIMLTLGAFKLGALVNFISHTVLVGFTAGAGVLIFASQLHSFFGPDIPHGGSFLQSAQDLLSHLNDIEPWAVLVAIATVLAGVLARRYWPRFPYMIAAMMAGIVVGFALNSAWGDTHTVVRVFGPLPGSLPPLSHPELSLETLRSLFGIAVAMTVLSLTQTISIVRAVGLRSGQRIDSNQEFIGQGLSNIAASFFSGYPSSASFNRTPFNYEAGARTPLAAVFSAGLLVVIVLSIAPLAAYLPIAAVAGLLFLVAWGLIDRRYIRAILTTSRGESVVLVTTFLSTLLLSLEFAILAGVTASLVRYLKRTSRPTMRSLVPDPRHTERKMTEIKAGLLECPQMKLLRIEGSIYFGAVNHVEMHFDTLREHNRRQKHLLLFAKSINFVDMTGAELLAREARKRAECGGALYFYSLRQPVKDLLESGGYLGSIGHNNIFHSKDEAIAGVFARLDRSVCAACQARIFNECKNLPSIEAST